MSARHNKIEDYVGQTYGKKISEHAKRDRLRKTEFDDQGPPVEKKDSGLVDYKWGHGRFSRPQEHFTTGPPLLPHLPRSESKRPSTAPNPVAVARTRQQQSRRSIKSSQSTRNRTNLNFLKKARAKNKHKSRAQAYKPTKYNFVRDPKSGFPSKIQYSGTTLSRNQDAGLARKEQEKCIDSTDRDDDTLDETNMPTANTRLKAIGDVSAALSIIDAWTLQSKKEESSFRSFSLFAKVHLSETLKSTRSYGIPNIPRSACCIELLLKMGRLFGRYSDLYDVLMREVLRTIYYKFDDMVIGSNEVLSMGQITAKMYVS